MVGWGGVGFKMNRCSSADPRLYVDHLQNLITESTFPESHAHIFSKPNRIGMTSK